MVMPVAGAMEESTFLETQAFLATKGLPVPRVFAHFPEQGIVTLEDLGDTLLETVFLNGDARAREFYSRAVEILSDMRRRIPEQHGSVPAFALAFDMEKLMFEMDFFLEHFVKSLHRARPSARALSKLKAFFTRICGFLADRPRVFTHRDYHSRNLMVRGDELVMIDFQDARMGPEQYDLASLIRDSYVAPPSEMADELIEQYLQATGRTEPHARAEFLHAFDIMSLQRNIKALGTFGYQTAIRGTSRYVDAIPRTASHIRFTLARLPELRGFHAVMEDFIFDLCARNISIIT
jgi:aminoglycoside/choline kinase family phosphotransferase